METIDTDILIPVIQPGDKLYHYTSAAGLKGICDGMFWVTESHFLNDTSEFQIATEVFCEVITDKIKEENQSRRITKAVRDEVNRLNSFSKVGDPIAYFGNYVLSFCLDKDSILMWSEYSDFWGYCLEFDAQKLIESFSKHHFMLHGKVIYDYHEQVSLAEKVFENMLFSDKYDVYSVNCWDDFASVSDEELNTLVTFLAVVIDGYNTFFKKECFKNENEYRLVFSCCHDGGRFKPEQLEKQHFRIKDEVLIPYVEKELSSLNALQSILIGPKNNSDIAIKGVEYFLRNKKISVPVQKSQMPLRY